MQVEQNIFYDQRHNQCDVYFDSSKQNAPVVLVVHGGAWIFGCKEDMQDICKFLVENGCVAIAVDYSLSQMDKTMVQKLLIGELMLLIVLFQLVKSHVFKVILLFSTLFLMVHYIVKESTTESNITQHPDHVMDVASAIEWGYVNAHKYGGDKDNVFLLGHSSGAHLSCLVTLNRRFLNTKQVPKNVIKGVIAISGPYSFWRIQQSSVKYFINENVFAITNDIASEAQMDVQDDNKQYWAKIVDAWPNFFQHAIDDDTPPFLLLTAGMDWSLLYHARDFADMLKQANVHVQVVHFESTTHFSIRARWSKENRNVGDVVTKFIHCIA